MYRVWMFQWWIVDCPGSDQVVKLGVWELGVEPASGWTWSGTWTRGCCIPSTGADAGGGEGCDGGGDGDGADDGDGDGDTKYVVGQYVVGSLSSPGSKHGAEAHAYNANNAKVAAKEQELRRLQEELRQQGDQYTRLLDTKVMIFT